MDKIFEKHGIFVSPKSRQQLEQYMNLLVLRNESMNLTAVTDRGEIIVKHFLDSLMLMKFENLAGKKLIDVGTGAGLPGLALKIAEDQLDVTLLDSLGKRVAFLDEVILELGLENVHTYHMRAEDGAYEPGLREDFNIAVSRAVAKLPMLCEYVLPYVKIGGLFVAYKGREYQEELAEAEAAIEILGAKPERAETFKLEEDYTRTLIFIRKLSQTPSNYPRKPHIIAKRPIMR